MMILSGENGAAFQRRVEQGGSSTHTEGTGAHSPHWVRLVRKSNVFYGYESSDGKNWEFVGSETIEMNDPIYIGIPVTSHNDNVICEAQLDNIKLNGHPLGIDDKQEIPQQYDLHAAYPNPFNPQTSIQFDIPVDGEVTLEIYDIQGRLVRSLVNKKITAGSHLITWDGFTNAGIPAASGLYLYRMQAGEYSAIKKVTLLK